MPSIEHLATSLAAQGMSSERLRHRLECEWDQLHLPIRHNQLPKLKPPKKTTKRCLAVGMCLCSARGRKIQMFERCCRQFLSQAFQAADVKSEALDGSLVLRLSCLAPEIDIASWYHISFLVMSRLPQACMWALEAVSSSTTAMGEEHIRLQPLFKDSKPLLFSVLEIADSLHDHLCKEEGQVSLTLFALVNDVVPVAAAQPKSIEVHMWRA